MERPPVFNCCSRMPGSRPMSLTMMDAPHSGMLLLDGHLEVIKWWIASGREMDLGQPGNEKNDAIGTRRKEKPRWFPCWRDSR